MTDEPTTTLAEVPEQALELPREAVLVATHPKELEAHHKSLLDTVTQRLEVLTQELEEHKQTLAKFQKSRWNTRSWKRVIANVDIQVDYYTKLKAALEAGYYVIPDFPVEVFAVRTSKAKPRKKRNNYQSQASTTEMEVLPAGEGKNVAGNSIVDSEQQPYVDYNGDKRKRTMYFPVEFMKVDIAAGVPMALVKPRIIDATAKALDMKIFDELGVMLPQAAQKGDPLIIGKIYDPTRNGHCVSFIVAWWFAPEDL